MLRLSRAVTIENDMFYMCGLVDKSSNLPGLLLIYLTHKKLDMLAEHYMVLQSS